MIDLYDIVKLVQGCVADDADSNLFAPHPIWLWVRIYRQFWKWKGNELLLYSL
mgnify:FL=1